MVSNSIAAMFWCLVLKTPRSLNIAESISAPCVIDFRSKETIAAVPDSHNLEGDRQTSHPDGPDKASPTPTSKLADIKND